MEYSVGLQWDMGVPKAWVWNSPPWVVCETFQKSFSRRITMSVSICELGILFVLCFTVKGSQMRSQEMLETERYREKDSQHRYDCMIEFRNEFFTSSLLETKSSKTKPSELETGKSPLGVFHEFVHEFIEKMFMKKIIRTCNILCKIRTCYHKVHKAHGIHLTLRENSTGYEINEKRMVQIKRFK